MKPSNQKKQPVKQPTKQTVKQSFAERFEKFTHNKFFILVLLFFVSIVYFANYNAIYDKKLDNNGDNIYYFSLGQSLAEGNGYCTPFGFTMSPHGHFPPGYPAFVSRILKIYPDDVQAVKKANGVLLYGAIILLFFSAYLISRNSILAFCVSVLASMHAEMLRFATIMMSEPLYIFLAMLAIFLAILLAKWDFQKKLWKLITLSVLLALTVFYIYFVRTMGLAVIIAIAGWLGLLSLVSLYQYIKTKKNDTETALIHKKTFLLRIILAVAVTLSCLSAKAIWDHRNKVNGISGKDYENTFFIKANNGKMEGVADWKARIKSNTSNYFTRWVPKDTYFKKYNDSDKEVTKKEWITGGLLAIVLLFGSFYGSGSLLMLFYVLLTVGVLVFYPEWYGGVRYIVPIAPALIFLLLNGFCAMIALIMKLFKKDKAHSKTDAGAASLQQVRVNNDLPLESNPSPATFILQSLLVLILTFGWLTPRYAEAQKYYRDLTTIKSWTITTDSKMVNYLKACEWCASNLSDTTRMSCRKSELYYMYSKFHKSKEFPRYGEPDDIYNWFCKNKITHLILDDWFIHAYKTVYPCIRKYPDKFKILQTFGEADSVKKTNSTYVMEFNDYWGYTGDLVDGKRQGEGVWRLQDGRIYRGHFENGLPNGYGELTTPDGQVVVGQWKNGGLVKSTSVKQL